MGFAVTASLVGRARLVPSVLRAVAAWAAALAVLAAWPTVFGALALLAVAGGARALIDVGSRTLLQRTSPSEILARVFGLLESMQTVALAVGSLLAPLLVAALGGGAAVLATGLLMPFLALLGGRRLLRLDASAKVPVAEIALLRSSPLFAQRALPRTATVRAVTAVRLYVLSREPFLLAVTGHARPRKRRPASPSSTSVAPGRSPIRHRGNCRVARVGTRCHGPRRPASTSPETGEMCRTRSGGERGDGVADQLDADHEA
jgi:MFS family permease